MNRKILSIKQQHVLFGVVPEVFRHGQGRVPHPEAGPGWLVHLAEDHDGAVQDPGFGHGPVKFLPLPASFADAAKDADALVPPHRVVDQFGDQHGFPDAGAAEQPALAAPFQGGQHVDGLDAGFKDFGDDGALGQRYGRLVDGTPFATQYFFLLIDHRAEDIEHPAQEPFPHRHFQVVAQVQHRRAPGQSVGGRQGDAPHDLGAQVGHHFDDDAALRAGRKLVVNGRKPLGKAHIHHAAADRHHRAHISPVSVQGFAHGNNS